MFGLNFKLKENKIRMVCSIKPSGETQIISELLPTLNIKEAEKFLGHKLDIHVIFDKKL